MLGLQLRVASSRSSRKHDAERNKKASKKSQVDQSVIVSVKSSDLYMKIHENINMKIVLHEKEEGKKFYPADIGAATHFYSPPSVSDYDGRWVLPIVLWARRRPPENTDEKPKKEENGILLHHRQPEVRLRQRHAHFRRAAVFRIH